MLRLLGTAQKRVRKICWLQIVTYLLSGIVLGTALGFAVSHELRKKQLYYGVEEMPMQWGSAVGILLLFLAISVFLRGTVREVAG